MNSMEGTANRKGQRIVITVAKKPHTGGLLNAAAPRKGEAGTKTDEEATRHALSVLASLRRLFGT